MPLSSLPTGSFGKDDPSPDALFYSVPRLVAHIDDRAIGAVTAAYRELLATGGAILDLMSSWISHLPPEADYREVVGHGMNAEELQANPRLTRWFVQDLNGDPKLPLDDGAFDSAAICVSIQYLEEPVATLSEVRRVLKPGAPVVISFSNRCFPSKAVAIWKALGGRDHAKLVALYLEEAGFEGIEAREQLPPGAAGDPLWIVVGRA